MRKISDKLKKRISSSVSTIAICWLLKLKNGKAIGFTDHAEDIEIDDMKYSANSGFASSSIESNASFDIDNLEVNGFLDSDFIKSKDILAGVYDYAYVEIFAVDYTSSKSGKLTLKAGYLGEVSLLNNQFCAEIRGISEGLLNNIGKLYSPTCRAEFCGRECKVNKSKYIEYGIVSEVLNKTSIKSFDLKIDNYLYSLGTIKFTSGKNKDISMSIKDCRNNFVVFMMELPNQITKGDKFVIFSGCDKKFETCCNYYNNAINFRGEPHLPGNDEILKIAGRL